MARNAEEGSKESTPNQLSQEPKTQDRWHIVLPGENLTNIAQAYYGPEHASHWITLYNFNREVIGENPDLITPGMELLIPDISEFL
jgi:nucleoid-associated protein YgaU